VSGGSTCNITQVASCQLKMATCWKQWSKEEVRAVIRFMNARHVSAAEIHRQLVEVYGEEVMSRQSVAKWCAHFKAGRVGTTDNERSERPTTASTPENKGRVEAAVWKTEE
jgi:hypothetical protein